VAGFTRLPQAAALAAANKRVSNILAKLEDAHEFGEVNTNLLQEGQETALSNALDAVATEVQGHLGEDDYGAALTAMAVLQEPVDAFFDGVMVNADDDALRNNRLNLLKALRDLFLQVADISQLVVSNK
jgi:glycyl-tRNA synthetase beta chain